MAFVCIILEAKCSPSVWVIAAFLFRALIATKDMDGIRRLFARFHRVFKYSYYFFNNNINYYYNYLFNKKGVIWKYLIIKNSLHYWLNQWVKGLKQSINWLECAQLGWALLRVGEQNIDDKRWHQRRVGLNYTWTVRFNGSIEYSLKWVLHESHAVQCHNAFKTKTTYDLMLFFANIQLLQLLVTYYHVLKDHYFIL